MTRKISLLLLLLFYRDLRADTGGVTCSGVDSYSFRIIFTERKGKDAELSLEEQYGTRLQYVT